MKIKKFNKNKLTNEEIITFAKYGWYSKQIHNNYNCFSKGDDKQ